MLGIIVTGHGEFAKGMVSNIKLLAGSDVKIQAVDFADGMDADNLEASLAAAVDSYPAAQPVFILADIAGGTPYNRAAGLTMRRSNLRVISGVNSSMLMDLCMRNLTGAADGDVDAIAEEILATGRENIGKFVLELPAQQGEETDGI